jgi:hypothetical protein
MITSEFIVVPAPMPALVTGSVMSHPALDPGIAAGLSLLISIKYSLVNVVGVATPELVMGVESWRG